MRVLVFAAAVALATGCAGSGAEKTEALGESVRSYNEGIRWERFEVAAASLPARERARAVDDWDTRAHDLKISDYEVVKVDQRGKRAKVQVKLTWYKTSEGTVHETQAVQYWEHANKTWTLVDEKHLRGAEMPGLAEPVDRAILDGSR